MGECAVLLSVLWLFVVLLSCVLPLADFALFAEEAVRGGVICAKSSKSDPANESRNAVTQREALAWRADLFGFDGRSTRDPRKLWSG